MASIRKRLNHFQMLCKANMQKNDWIKWFIILFTLFPGVRLEDHLRSNVCNNRKTLCDVTSWVLALRPSPSWIFKTAWEHEGTLWLQFVSHKEACVCFIVYFTLTVWL